MPQYNVYIKDSKSKTERLITMIGSQPFYRSSGRNSQNPDTFFPFEGFKLKFNSKGQSYIWMIKPRVGVYKIENYFPFDFLTRIDPYQSAFLIKVLQRMGNFKNLGLSMLMGGGFWNSHTGKIIANILHDDYPSYVYNLMIRYSAAIETIKQNKNTIYINFNSSKHSSLSNKLKSITMLNEILKTAFPIMPLKQSEIYDEESRKTYHALQPIPRKYSHYRASFYSPMLTESQIHRTEPKNPLRKP